MASVIRQTGGEAGFSPVTYALLPMVWAGSIPSGVTPHATDQVGDQAPVAPSLEGNTVAWVEAQGRQCVLHSLLGLTGSTTATRMTDREESMAYRSTGAVRVVSATNALDPARNLNVTLV